MAREGTEEIDDAIDAKTRRKQRTAGLLKAVEKNRRTGPTSEQHLIVL